ncbi:MAG: BrnT family toxin [bacterium]|nr:BrnT family toxin [bacterium]
MELEWNEDKRETNIARHGVDFLDAVRVFLDEHRLWGYDEAHSDLEDRWWALGRVHDLVLFVVTTERRGVTRMISARKATRNEQTTYYENLTG